LGNVEEVEFNVYKNIALWKASGALRHSRRDVKYLNASNANITLSSRPRLHFYRAQRMQEHFPNILLFIIAIICAKNYFL